VKKISDAVCCVVDAGQFLPVARRIGEQVSKCYYWSPQDRSLPLIQEAVIGDGFSEVERIPKGKSFFDVATEVDFFVFPDIGFAGEQRELISQGHMVWGARGLDSLEYNRGKFLRALKSCGLEVPKHEVIRGLNNLRLFLDDKKDMYIKMSNWRGNFETFHWVDNEQTSAELDNLAVEFGPMKEHLTFYVFYPIDTDIEDGIDTYCINGEYPNLVLHGVENKDKSFLGTMCEFSELPEQVREVNEKFAPILKDYRGFFSTEVRILPDKHYFIDPTCRAPSPPHQSQCMMWDNYAEILYQGAAGNCIDPEPNSKFCVQALLSYKRNEKEWVSFKIPESIKTNVKCGFCCEVDGLLCFPPHPLETMAGYLVATGDTIKEAIDVLQKCAKELPPGLNCEDKSIADLLILADNMSEDGVPLTEATIPEPSIVLE
jgi:hypothetical protein